MQALLLDAQGKQRRWPLTLLALGWLFAVGALAGPTWERLPVPVYQGSQATVFVVSLADSMNAADLKPSRIGRARFELQDAVRKVAGDQLALVIFSDEPYVVTPLADDPQVLIDTVPILATNLMPVTGARLDRALQQAEELLVQAGVGRGRILLLTDSVGEEPSRSLEAARHANESGFPVSVLAFGTKDGAPVPNPRGQGFLQNASGQPVLAQLKRDELVQLASAGGGEFALSTADDRDLDRVLPVRNSFDLEFTTKAQEAAGFDSWKDVGAWLVWFPLLLALFAFRREGGGIS